MINLSKYITPLVELWEVEDIWYDNGPDEVWAPCRPVTLDQTLEHTLAVIVGNLALPNVWAREVP